MNSTATMLYTTTTARIMLTFCIWFKPPTTYTRVSDFGTHMDSIFRGQLIHKSDLFASIYGVLKESCQMQPRALLETVPMITFPLTTSPPWRTGEDHHNTFILRGWRLSSRTWNPIIISPWMKQLTWLRIVHSGDWCVCLVLRTPGGVWQKWRTIRNIVCYPRKLHQNKTTIFLSYFASKYTDK